MSSAPESQGHNTPALPVGQLAQAEQQLRRLVEKEPGNVAAWFELGQLALRQNQPAAAIAPLQKAVALDPRQATVHHHLAAAFQTLGQRDQAAHHYHQVVCLKPEVAEAHNNWGIALAQQGHGPEALAAFAQALRLKPEYPEAHNNWGIALVEQGQLDQAIDHFRQALQLHLRYPEAHNNLALALARKGQSADALAALQEAVRLQPDYADAHNNLGNLYRDLGRLAEAIPCYREVLRLRTDHREARLNLALVLSRLGQFEEAVACLHQNLLFHPDSPEIYNFLGVLLSQRDRLDEASAAFRQAFRLKPDNAEALNNLGNTLLRQQKSEEAIRCFHQALQLRQDYAQPYCNLGSALMQQGNNEEAVPQYQEALRLQPDYLDAHFNLGNAYRNLGRFPEAVACFQQVLQRQPEHAGARLNMGVALSEQGQHDEATAVLQETIRRHPDLAQGYNSLGVNCLHQGRPRDGLVQFEEGLQRNAEDAEIHLNRALTWLLLGDYESGWAEYEWRWKLKKAMPCPYPQPAWDGQALPQGSIVLWSEQGLGDSLQFIRYAALVKERVGKVLLNCPGPLRSLLASCPGVDGLTGAGETGPAADVQAPLLSLPRILGTTAATIPAATPYLFPDSALRDRWKEKIGPARGLKVGLFWQGNAQFTGDRYRSVRLEQFRPLAEVPGVQLFSLQKGKGSEQLADLAQEWDITDLGKEISPDFSDTAAALVNRDLVVSVDTSVAHLAGALGVPVWVLLPFNPDWRWFLERQDSPWYPSARLFRQKVWGDWDEVFVRLAQALRERVRRPLIQRVAIPLELTELWERAVREGRPNGSVGQSWDLLRQAGVPESADLTQMANRLKAAHEALERLDQEMQARVAQPNLKQHAAGLVRRQVQAKQERAAALTAFSAWLAGEDQARPQP